MKVNIQCCHLYGWTKTFFKIYFAFHRRKKGCKGAHNSKETNLREFNHVLSYFYSLVLLKMSLSAVHVWWTHCPSRAEIEMCDCCFIWFWVMCPCLFHCLLLPCSFFTRLLSVSFWSSSVGLLLWFLGPRYKPFYLRFFFLFVCCIMFLTNV